MQTDYADVNGVRLHYAHAGSGKLILFLHGFPQFWYAWKRQLDEFSTGFFAVAPDMRGYNLSSKPDGADAYKMRHLVDDVRGLADYFGQEKFILVGHDWGGAVAWSFAAKWPRRLEKLVIVNAPHAATFARELSHNAQQIAASQYMLLFRLAKAERVLAENDYLRLSRMLKGYGAHADWLTPAEQTHYLQAWSQPGALTASLNYYRASPLYPPADSDPGARAFSIDPQAVRVDVPTLVIWGEQDTALLAGNLDGLQAHVPNLTVKRIADGSHWVVHEQPNLVGQFIREFVAS
jgi:epoxide hydrolase 4